MNVVNYNVHQSVKNWTPEQQARRVWMRKNRGVLARIAAELDVSRTMVSLVVNGHRSSVDGKIEDELRKNKVPGWDKENRHAAI